jgi:hypothetical protein
VHPATSSAAPSWDDADWAPVSDFELIGPGQFVGGAVVDPTVIDVGAQTSRYLRLEARNDGRYGDAGYIELRSVKLFSSGTECGQSCSKPFSEGWTVTGDYALDVDGCGPEPVLPVWCTSGG